MFFSENFSSNNNSALHNNNRQICVLTLLLFIGILSEKMQLNASPAYFLNLRFPWLMAQNFVEKIPCSIIKKLSVQLSNLITDLCE